MAKIRNGFVTNSSSSSFVIAFKESENYPPEILKKYPELECYRQLITSLLFEENYYTCERYVSKSKDEYNENVLKMYWYDSLDELFDDEYAKKEYEKSIEYLDKGYYIINMNVDYSDTLREKIIKQLSKNENFIVLFRE